MNNLLEWWHWMVGGLGLVILELLILSFFVIWFGLAAMGVGVVLLIAPMLSLPSQLVLWALFSATLTFAWFRYLRPKTISTVGTSESAQGEVGYLVGDLSPQSRGYVRFQKPILGAEQWECYADHTINAGSRVRIVQIEGQFIKVESTSI